MPLLSGNLLMRVRMRADRACRVPIVVYYGIKKSMIHSTTIRTEPFSIPSNSRIVWGDYPLSTRKRPSNSRRK